MSINFLYNKTSLQSLEKNLMMRLRALPTIKNRESALRIEVKKTQQEIVAKQTQLDEFIKQCDSLKILWGELNTSLLRIDRLQIEQKKILGVAYSEIKEISFLVEEYSLFNSPAWTPYGFEVVKGLVIKEVEIEFLRQKQLLFESARKKTTRKLNLFDKVQIPEYKEAMAKIKRFLEDEDNISKASKKIVKEKFSEY